MANTIKHKRGSGSDPAANDLVVGELAIRTDTGTVFTKKTDGTVVQITGGGGNAADADTVDSLHASSFLRSDATTTFNASGNDFNFNSDGSRTLINFNHNGSTKWRLLQNNSGNNLNFDNVAGTEFQIASNKAWHAGNDGSGSGLDADTLDGVQGASYLRSDANDTYTGTLSITGQIINSSTAGASGAILGNLEVGYGAAYNSISARSNNALHLNYNSSGIVYVGSGNKVFHAGNDGPGSGLDADTVDGIAALSFLRSDADDSFTGTITGTADAQNNPVLIVDGPGPNIIRFPDNGSNTLGIDLVFRTGPNSLGFEKSTDGTNLWQTDCDTGVTNFNYTPTASNNTIWHAGNDGAGSGLDADTLDGVQAASFLRSDATDTTSGDLRIGGSSNNIAIGLNNTGASGSVGHTANYNEGIFWHNSNTAYGIYRTAGAWSGNYQQLELQWTTGIRLDGGVSYGQSGVRVIGNNNSLLVNGNVAWNAGNDGAGSGLDADRLDSLHATSFLRADSATGNAVHRVEANAGNGIRFWGGSTSYAIWMSDSANSSYGGRLDNTSDYNMYFRMSNGTNRGFVFQNSTNEIAQIEGNGNFTAIGNVTAYSDVRLKTNIEVIPDALDKVCKIRGVTFDRTDNGLRQSGVIAQEVEKVLPEVVTTGQNDMKSVAYGNLNGLLIEAIKELRAEVADLKSQLEAS